MATDDQINNQKDLNDHLKESADQLGNVKEEVGLIQDAFLSISESIKHAVYETVDALTGIDTVSKKIVKHYSRELVNSAKSTVMSLDKQLALEEQLNEGKDISLKLAKEEERLRLLKIVQTQRMENLEKNLAGVKDEEAKDLRNQLEEQKKALELENSQADTLVEKLKERNIQQQQSLGILGKLSGGLDGILNTIDKTGNLSKILNIPEAISDTHKWAAEKKKIEGTNRFDLGGGVKGKIGKLLPPNLLKIGKLISNLGKNLLKAFGPLVLLKELVDAFLKSDKIVGDMAKGLNKSYSEALSMKMELTETANFSNSIFVTSEKLSESLMTINKTLGTNVMLNKEDLVTFTKLREMAGFTNEELMGIQALAYATGTSLEDNTKEFMAQAKITAIQNGVMLNEKELAKGIKDISAATTLSLGKNPKALGEAVAVAKSLGMELSKIEAISESLLQFETSIGNELKAELLTGRQLNLEQARYFALTNDVAGVAREIASQLGSASEFSKMNRIQQEALAKAVGMNREELAKTLYVQEQLGGATGDVAKEQRALLNSRIEDVGLAQAQKEMEDKGFEGLQKQVGMQDKFNASVEKLKEIFTTVAESVMPILNILSDVFKIIGPIVNILVRQLTPALKFVSLVLTPIVEGLQWVFTWGESDFSGTKQAPADFIDSLGNTVQGQAYKALTGQKSELFGVGDIASPAKGKTQVSTKEGGLFELSPNDDVIAAPNLISPSSTTTNNQTTTNTSTTTLDLNPLINEVREMKSLLSAILNKEGDVYIDGNKAGKSLVMAASQMG